MSIALSKLVLKVFSTAVTFQTEPNLFKCVSLVAIQRLIIQILLHSLEIIIQLFNSSVISELYLFMKHTKYFLLDILLLTMACI